MLDLFYPTSTHTFNKCVSVIAGFGNGRVLISFSQWLVSVVTWRPIYCSLWDTSEFRWWRVDSPFVEQDGNDDAYNEDHGQHGAHHPDEALLLVNDWLRVDVSWHHWVRVGARGVHDLKSCKQIFRFTLLSPTCRYGQQFCTEFRKQWIRSRLV